MYQWKKDVVQWRCGRTLYLSVPFTWLLSQAEQIAAKHKGKIIAGGPAVKLMGAPWADETPETCDFDVLSFHNPCATFTTRGCPNRCGFCAVPRIEGEFRELPSWKPAPLGCDNNLLASSKRHFVKVIDSLLPFPEVDFNQGLDARLFQDWHASEIARLHHARVRFSFDHVSLESVVADAVARARKHGLKDIGIYVLIGFNDTPADALHRLSLVKSWGLLPNPMRFHPLDALEHNSYVAPQWTEYEMKRMTRYWARQVYLGHVPYEEYQPEGTLFAEK